MLQVNAVAAKALPSRPDTFVQVEHNYFRLLGVPPRFDLDVATLKSNARKLQREYHPDRYASRAPQEQRLAAQLSAQINSAQATLQDPVRRAIYLLEQQGVETNAQSHTERNTEFLMQQMALREELEAARMARDVGALQALEIKVKAAFKCAQQDFAGTPAGQGEKVDTMHAALFSLISRMRFYQKLLEELQAAHAAIHNQG
ncbi:MAG: Fe-S protein assembly co-chaperone HscB [Pseudomonadales bacterium]